jgi:hypothetical protein
MLKISKTPKTAGYLIKQVRTGSMRKGMAFVRTFPDPYIKKFSIKSLDLPQP